MKYEPYEYQTEAAKYILRRPACALFLECGLGKTVITLTALKALKRRGEVKKILVVAPLRVALHSWPSEIQKWDHLKGLTYSLVTGTAFQRKKALAAPADIYIINRENVAWLVEVYYWDFDCVVADELSSFKSSKSKRFRALKKIRPEVKRFIGLTGTPAPNGLYDLWAQIYLLDMGKRLGKNKRIFEQRYFTEIFHPSGAYSFFKLKEGADKEIYGAVSDVCMSMKAEDYIALPERIDNVISVALDPSALTAYKNFERKKVLEIAGAEEITAANAAVLINKLLQFANGAVYNADGTYETVGDCKIEALKELVELNSEPALVLYSFKSDRERLNAAFGKFKPVSISAPSDIDRWNAGEIRLALAHPAAVGHGLNLQYGGRMIIWFGLPWSLELYLQANARLHRQGQKKTVIAHHLLAKDTADEDVYEALKLKKAGQEALIEAVKARAAKYGDLAGRSKT